MKKKISRKHLFFNKETIVHLNPLEMGNLNAGCGVLTLEETCFECGTINPTQPKESQNTCFTEN